MNETRGLHFPSLLTSQLRRPEYNHSSDASLAKPTLVPHAPETDDTTSLCFCSNAGLITSSGVSGCTEACRLESVQ